MKTKLAILAALLVAYTSSAPRGTGTDYAVSATNLRSAGWYWGDIIEPYIEGDTLFLTWDYPGAEHVLNIPHYVVEMSFDNGPWQYVGENNFREFEFSLMGLMEFTTIGVRIATQFQDFEPHYSDTLWATYIMAP